MAVAHIKIVFKIIFIDILDPSVSECVKLVYIFIATYNRKVESHVYIYKIINE
jgi:hypothetical protein